MSPLSKALIADLRRKKQSCVTATREWQASSPLLTNLVILAILALSLWAFILMTLLPILGCLLLLLLSELKSQMSRIFSTMLRSKR